MVADPSSELPRRPRHPSRRGPSRRLRRLWGSVLATCLGLAFLLAAGLWIDRSRDTDFDDGTSQVTRALLEAPPQDAPRILWREVAAESGIEARHGPGPRRRLLTEDTGSGLAWGDYDGDGDVDLYLVSFGTDPEATQSGHNRLLRNEGPAALHGGVRFSDQTEVAGVGDPDGFGMGASFIDFNGDGALDLFVTNYGQNRLFRNRGDGTFAEVAVALGLADDSWSVGATWGDIDRDGRLDLYVANYLDYPVESFDDWESTRAGTGGESLWEGVPYTLNPNAFDPVPNQLFRQLADGRFEEIAVQTGVSNPDGRSLGATLVDLDQDGWLDLYVANDVSPNALFRSLAGDFGGDLLFEDLSAQTGTADPRGSMGISVGSLAAATADPSIPSRPDLFITHWIAQENALYRALPTSGTLEYHDKVRQFRLGEISTDRVGWGSAFLDFDLDGNLDLAVANGSTLEVGSPPALEAQPPFLFWNAGDRFFDVTPQSGEAFATARVGRGLAVADYDLDGDVDIAISVNRGAPVLWRNDLEPADRQWLSVTLDAPASQTRGSVVTLEPHGGSAKQHRFWGADVSFASGHANAALFGIPPSRPATLDRSPPASTLEVRWNHGPRQRYAELESQRRYVIR